jgi:ribonuclease Z
MSFSLTILGNNSAVPAFGRNPTAQVLQLQGEQFLIDCGEGTQLQMAKFKVKKSKISHIFISHMHGDHYLGLMGLLTSMGLLSRKSEIHLHGPALLIDIINLQLEASHTELPYPLIFHPLGDDRVIAETEKITVSSVRVKHGIECWGFIFREKKNPRRLLADKIRSYQVPHAVFETLQQGGDYMTEDGRIIPNTELTEAHEPAKSYAYSADTIFDLSLAEKFKGVDMLYHETTYLKDQETKAGERFHSTTIQAAEIAKRAGVKKLLIGHFSSKYDDLRTFAIEAKSIFENSELALEGTTYWVS